MDTEEKSGDKKNKVNMVNVEKKKITNDDVGDEDGSKPIIKDKIYNIRQERCVKKRMPPLT